MKLSAQKYKIWVNTSWMVFLSTKEYKNRDIDDPIYLLLRDPKTNQINGILHQMQSGLIQFPTVILSRNRKSLWNKFLHDSNRVFAAGGLIKREDEKYLFFYRRGSWDLPKGKVDKKETFKQAALREVNEEVGLTCTILKKMPITFHTYILKDKLVLKQTYWYEMSCKRGQVRLQHEEDIEKSKWVSKDKVNLVLKNIYPNLSSLLAEYWNKNL
ncbi:MAG: NUDIX domain-containing protein [Saprospiraceae bacterium]